MKKYHISGKEKAFPDTTPSCSVCKDGEIHKDRQYVLDSIYPKIQEYSCLECMTKYKVDRIVPELPLELLSARDIYESEIQGLKIDGELMTENNYPYFAIKIADDYAKEVKMNPKVVELREQYAKTKECKEHVWIESKPFKTAEGTFSIKNCAVCKEASVLYKGKTKTGNFNELINYLVSQSIIFNEKALTRGDMFSDMILKGIDFDVKPKQITEAITEAKELNIPEKKEIPQLF